MNFYQILEISPLASEAEIRTSFRRLAIKFHPDTSKEPNAAEMFKLVYMAYEILNDPDKRQIYNELLIVGAVGSEGIWEENYISSGRRYDEWRREAARRAQAYSQMKYEEFEDTLLRRISFHGKQVFSFFIFFVLLCMGMALLIVGYYYLFKEHFNGSKLIGLICLAFGVAIAYTCLKALYGVLEIWRKQ